MPPWARGCTMPSTCILGLLHIMLMLAMVIPSSELEALELS